MSNFNTLCQFCEQIDSSLTEGHHLKKKKHTQNQRLQLGIICKEEKTNLDKLTLCFYSSHVDIQQLMLNFSGHTIGLLIAAVIKALIKPHVHFDHTN